VRDEKYADKVVVSAAASAPRLLRVAYAAAPVINWRAGTVGDIAAHEVDQRRR
jgi:hypothetical protein